MTDNIQPKQPMRARTSTWLTIGLLSLIAAILAVVSQLPYKEVSTPSEQVQESTREAVYSSFMQGCNTDPSKEQYCACTATNLSAALTPEILYKMDKLADAPEAEIDAFIAPYAKGCA
jgi:hypothetical protein